MQAIICIPNRLIVSLDRVSEGELKYIIDQNPSLFDEEKTHDAEFNILSLFVVREKLKKEGSLFHPYFQAVGKTQTLLNWSEQDIREVEDQLLIEEFKQFKKDMRELSYKFYIAIRKCPEFEAIGNFGEFEDTFYDSYQFVMTRC